MRATSKSASLPPLTPRQGAGAATPTARRFPPRLDWDMRTPLAEAMAATAEITTRPTASHTAASTRRFFQGRAAAHTAMFNQLVGLSAFMPTRLRLPGLSTPTEVATLPVAASGSRRRRDLKSPRRLFSLREAASAMMTIILRTVVLPAVADASRFGREFRMRRSTNLRELERSPRGARPSSPRQTSLRPFLRHTRRVWLSALKSRTTPPTPTATAPSAIWPSLRQVL